MKTRAIFGAAAVIVLVSGVIVGDFLSLVPLVLIVFVLWIVALRGILGLILTIPVTVLFGLWSMVALDYVIAAFSLPALTVNLVMWSILGFAALAVIVVRREIVGTLEWSKVAVWGAPAFGGLLWLALFALNSLGVSSVGTTWAMSGDAATFVTQARDIIILGGAEIWNNAVPVAAAVAALAMLGGRDPSGTTHALQSDVQGLALAWALCIALSCWVFGTVVVLLLREKRIATWILVVAGMGSSLIPLTWLYSGYALYFGFLNATVALVVSLLTMLAFLVGRHKPALLLSFLFVACTVTFLAWSPLVVVPMGLSLIVLILNLRKLHIARGFDLGVLLFGFGQLIAFGIWQAAPFFIATQGASSTPGSSLLVATGAAIYFRPGYLLAIFVGVVLVVALAFVRTNRYVLWGVVTATLSIGAGFWYMVRGSGHLDFPWLYYPSKFIWIGFLILLPFGLGAFLAWALQHAKKWIASLVILALFAVGGVFFFKASATWGHINGGISTPTAFNELLDTRDVIQIDRLPNSSAAGVAFALEDEQHLNFLWDSGNQYESQINFWLLKMWSTSTHGDLMLGDFIYGLKGHDLANLCQLVSNVKTAVTITTADPLLAGALNTQCPGNSALVVVSPK